MHPSFVPYRVAGAYIAKRLQDEGIDNPEVGIICGSGLSELSQTLEGKTLTVRTKGGATHALGVLRRLRHLFLHTLLSCASSRQIKYSDIPGFPKETTVVGHKGEVVIGQLAGVTTICFRGRFHCYEGHSLKRVVLPGK